MAYPYYTTTYTTSGTDYNITWDGTDVSCDDWPEPEILEDGPWSPLYEYEDYEGIMHAVLAMELGLDEEDI